jgi:hexulose-6-phosphate isomerase
MPLPVHRRDFLTASAGLAAGLGFAGSAAAQTGGRRGGGAGAQAASAPAAPLTFTTKLHKALIARPTEKDLVAMKEAGFDGIEGRVVPPDEAAKTRQLAEKIGMRIHSVTRGWALFNIPDRAQETFEVTEGALRTAEAFGADAILLVPCHIGERNNVGTPVTMPRPWEFVIEHDDRTGHLTRVVYADNARYADYIKAHNHAIDASREWVGKLIPLAEKTKVVIALENVSNRLWVMPEIFAHFVRSFRSPWVKAYYDIGNHLRYAPPERWILAIGDLLSKVHVKDYKLDLADPNGMGEGVNIREGDTRWPVLRQALDLVGYNGWMTIEGSGSLSMAERSKRLDQIIAGT